MEYSACLEEPNPDVLALVDDFDSWFLSLTAEKQAFADEEVAYRTE